MSLLESMEHQEDHFFWAAEKKRREEEEKEEEKRRSDEEITPSSRAAAERLRDARMWVFSQLLLIASHGLPGMWVLRHQDIYLPEQSVCRPHQETTMEETTMAIPSIRILERLGLGNGSFGLRYDGDSPPDFNDIRYWENKLEELKAKEKEVEAGRVKHGFTKLEQLKLHESEQESDTEIGGTRQRLVRP